MVEAAQILCRQCNAPLPVGQGTQFVTCEFCGTTNFVDKGRAVFHYAVQTTLRENDAEAALRRWMAGNDTIKGLDKKAAIERPSFTMFPMWLIRVERDNQEEVILEPAAALSVSELKELSLAAGQLESYDHDLDRDALEVTVPYEAMTRWLADDHGMTEQEIREVSLVHLPVYQFKYTFQERRYTAVVDGATGAVFANIFPTKWEAPYFAMGAISFLIYFCLSFAPTVGFLASRDAGSGLVSGIVIYVVGAIIAAIPIFIAASVISAKV